MTNTALATQSGNAIAEKPKVEAGGPLAALVPQSLDDAFRLSKALASAGDMVPEHFQGKPEATMAAIVRGMEIGLAPMQALASIAVINGRASIWGDALPALMLRAGHHIDVEITGDGDKAVATATLTRGDTGKTIVRTFSMADAKRAGLAGKPGPWQQYPLRMLSNRARAFAIRDGAADALMGMSISDEVSDYGPDRARDVTPTAPRRGGVIYTDPDPEPAADVIHEAEAEVIGERDMEDVNPHGGFDAATDDTPSDPLLPEIELPDGRIENFGDFSMANDVVRNINETKNAKVLHAILDRNADRFSNWNASGDEDAVLAAVTITSALQSAIARLDQGQAA